LSSEEAEKLYLTLALGALKYFLLKVEPKKRMLFNPKESIDFQGNTGPFIQYTYARISAIGRKAAQTNISIDTFSDLALNEVELDLIEKLDLFTKRIEEAALNYSPSTIANYVYELAKTYNRFYAEVPVFTDSDPSVIAFRVSLSKKVGKTIKNAMGLLGIEVPERM